MARGAARKQIEPDTAVVTDAEAEAPASTPEDAQDGPNEADVEQDSTDASNGPEDGTDGAEGDPENSTDDDPEDDGDVVLTDGGGRTLVEVVADGVTVRVGGHHLLLTAGQRARVRSEVADRPSFRRV